MHKCFLAIGTNLGDREQNIFRSLTLIQNLLAEGMLCCSSVIQTDAILLENAQLHWNLPFLNCVIYFFTIKKPKAIFDEIKNIEQTMGRNFESGRWSPRIIDIDIILYDNISYADSTLTIPHTQMHKRYFVMKPLCEIYPDGIHPVLGMPFAKILAEL